MLILGRAGPPLLDAALAAAVFSGLVALAMVACTQPARRLLLARTALIGLLAMVPLVLWGPVPRLDVAGSLRGFAPPEPTGPVGPSPTPSPTPEPPALPGGFRRWGPPLAVGLYAAGVAVGLARLALGWWGVGRLVARSVEPGPEALASYGRLPWAGPGRRPRLRVHPRVGRPALVGLIRPTILLPPAMDQPDGSREDLRLSLRHELAHAERLDPAFGLVGAIAGAIAWPIAPVWWMRAQHRLDQEYLADRGASSDWTGRGAYASSLVGLAAPPAAGPGPVGSSAPRAGLGSALFLRVLMLLRCPFPVELTAPRWFRIAVPPAVALAAVLASALTLRGYPPSEPDGHPATDPHGTLHVARLRFDEPRVAPVGQNEGFGLAPLPESFELTLQLNADRDDLPKIRLAGVPLGDALGPGAETRWHAIRLVRDRRGLRLWVDQRPVPVPAGAHPTWLSLETPSKSGRVRDLVLRW